MPQTLPFALPIATARVELTLSGERVVINQPVEYRFSDKTFGEIRRELKVAPAITLTVQAMKKREDRAPAGFPWPVARAPLAPLPGRAWRWPAAA